MYHFWRIDRSPASRICLMSSTLFLIDLRINLKLSYVCFDGLVTVLKQVCCCRFYGVLHLIFAVSLGNDTSSVSFFFCAYFSFFALISSINLSKANGFLRDSSSFSHKSFSSSSWTVPYKRVLKNILYFELEMRSSSMTGVDLYALLELAWCLNLSGLLILRSNDRAGSSFSFVEECKSRHDWVLVSKEARLTEEYNGFLKSWLSQCLHWWGNQARCSLNLWSGCWYRT